MQQIKNVVLVGLGAIGSTYASRIMDTNPTTLRVVATEERAERWGQGVSVNSKMYHFPLVSPHGAADPADLVLVSVKFHHLPQAIADMKRFVAPKTVILSLLNGISSEEIIGQAYGMDKLLYALCVGIDAVREAGIVNYSSTGKIFFGEKENFVSSARVEAVCQFFNVCAINYEIPQDMIRALWWKFMANVGINQMSGVLRATYDAFHRIPQAAELMTAAMREVIQISVAAGIGLTEKDIEDFYYFLNTLSPDGKTSMLQDIEAGRKTEVEMFAKEVCRLGILYNVPTPVNELLYKMIVSLEQMSMLR